MTQCRNKRKNEKGLLLWSGRRGLKPSESLGVLKIILINIGPSEEWRFRCFRMEPGSLYFWKSWAGSFDDSPYNLNYWLKPWELCLPKAYLKPDINFFCCEEIVQHIWVKQFQYKKLTPWKMLTDLDYLYIFCLKLWQTVNILQMFINNVSTLYYSIVQSSRKEL